MSFAIRYNPQKTIEVLTLETENVDQGTIKKKIEKIENIGKNKKNPGFKNVTKRFLKIEK